jgi:hypothetical protein
MKGMGLEPTTTGITIIKKQSDDEKQTTYVDRRSLMARVPAQKRHIPTRQIT